VSVSRLEPGADGGDAQSAFAATLVDEWVRGGVSHAVVCPGSRSTPLAVALAAHPDLRVHVRLDERSAGFTAVGIGLATGVPAVVLTTSGTAAAELHAAVVEADLAAVPLIAATADRPPERRDVGAPQTIDQSHLFGRSVRWFADPGVPTDVARSSWRPLASRAVGEATSGTAGPGPVHLNLPFREPLLTDPSGRNGVVAGRPDGSPWHGVAVGTAHPRDGWARSLVDAGTVQPGSRGLIVAGAGCGEPDTVLALSDALGWPILADARSGLRRTGRLVVGAADGILRSDRFARGHAPDVVVHLGQRWVSKVVNAFLSEAVEQGALGLVVDPWGRWPDPEQATTVFARCDPTAFCRDLTRCLVDGDAPPSGGDRKGHWSDEWQEAEDRSWAAVRAALRRPDGAARSDALLTEPELAHRLFAHLPDGAVLMVSSSMPVRDIEAFASPREQPPRVVSNRGANGIDGVVSTALGVAIGGSAPTVALVGDLAFLHDASALVGVDGDRADVTVVVADNGGGGIFSFLDPASALDPPTFETLFATPHDNDIAAVAAGLGWPVDDVGPGGGSYDLEETLDRRVGMGVPSVIRVRLPGRSENVLHHERLNAAIVRAVDQPGGS
jgi:2-succinyl-5-enolpyruvyl-6-hydroxy-3-cyclohexene-1-carboxylate synthase